jgi:hypothetical protein
VHVNGYRCGEDAPLQTSKCEERGKLVGSYAFFIIQSITFGMFSFPMSLSDRDAAVSDGDDGAVPVGFMRMKNT